MNSQKRRAIELAARFKRRYDAQMLQAKIDYMASLYAPCVLAIVGDEVYSYNSDSAALLAHGFKAVYYSSYRPNDATHQDIVLRGAYYEISVCKKYGMCYHFNKNLCKCLHTGTTGEYWVVTPLADGSVATAKVMTKRRYAEVQGHE